MKEALTPVARIVIDDDRILKVTYAPDSLINLENVKTVLAAIQRLCGGDLLPVLVDVRHSYSMHADASRYAREHQTPRLATAIVTNNVFYKLLANLYAGWSNHHPPVKVFTTEAKAITWLSTFHAAGNDNL